MFTLSKKEGSPSLALAIGIAGLLLTLLAPPYHALTCYECTDATGSTLPCSKPNETECTGPDTACRKSVKDSGLEERGCINPDLKELVPLIGKADFRGCKFSVKSSLGATYNEFCICNGDKCNVADTRKYPSSGGSGGSGGSESSGPSSSGSISRPSLSLSGVTFGGAAVLIIAYLNNLLASAHPPQY